MNFKKAITPLAVVFALVSGVNAADAHSQDQLADLVDDIAPATVNITILKEITDEGASAGEDLVPQNNPFSFLDDFNPKDTDEPVYTRLGVGSGFVIDMDNCYVVTNNHVAEGGDAFTVTFPNGTELSAQTVGLDPRTDLAVLKTECDKPLDKEVKWADSDQVRVGNDVIAIGNPQGLSNTVTKGIVSALNRDIMSGPYDQYIQTDTSINQGNSGGGLFNLDGEVVGVNTAIFSSSGGSVGLGFAIPSNVASHVADQLIKYGEVKRGWIGVEIQGLNDAVADHLELDEPRGALIANVTPDGPSEASGLKQADVILEFDGQAVETARDLPRIVALTPVDEEVELKVWRDGEEISLQIKVGELVEAEPEVEVEAETEAEGSEPAPTDEGPITPETLEPEIPKGFKIPRLELEELPDVEAPEAPEKIEPQMHEGFQIPKPSF